jgi:hypothetical protein
MMTCKDHYSMDLLCLCLLDVAMSCSSRRCDAEDDAPPRLYLNFVVRIDRESNALISVATNLFVVCDAGRLVGGRESNKIDTASLLLLP